MKTTICLLVACSLLTACGPSAETQNTSPNAALIGAWSWDKLAFSDKDTSYVWNDLDGQLMFTENQYSMIYVYRSTPRDTASSARLKQYSIEHLQATFGPVTANSGNYRVEGDSILLFREVALWPNSMVPDAQPNKLRMPEQVMKDTLIWRTNSGFEFTWVRKK